MNKKQYEKPAMEVIRFETEDIITTSGGGGIKEDDYMTDILPMESGILQ